MCIAILQTVRSEPLSIDTVERLVKRHPHGMGIAWVEKYDIQVFKTLDDLDAFWNVYCQAVVVQTPIMLHFRQKTQGDATLANTQPFYVNDDIVFCHNGHFSRHTRKSVRSDTRLFNEEILHNLPDNFLEDPTLVALLEGYIATNKIIMLGSDGRFSILNEQAGDWVNGTWYSNTTYKEYKKYTPKKETKALPKTGTTTTAEVSTSTDTEEKKPLTHEEASKWLTDTKNKASEIDKMTEPEIVEAEVVEVIDDDVPDIIRSGAVVDGDQVVCFHCYPLDAIREFEDDWDFLVRDLTDDDVTCEICEVGLIYLEEQEENISNDQRWLEFVEINEKEVANNA